MDLVIKPLTAEMAELFTTYLSGLHFDHAPHWATCFCRYYYLDGPTEEWMARSGETNRKEAIAEIEAGRMNGYLAFDGDQCIGWCNAADANQFARIKDAVEEYCMDDKVGCTICFVIHPEYRNRGVARSLLETAITEFKKRGYDAMIALPFEAKDSPEKRYRGTINMYEQMGYKEIERQDSASIMWLDLRDE